MIIEKENILNLFRQVFIACSYAYIKEEIIGRMIWLSNSKTSMKESSSQYS